MPSNASLVLRFELKTATTEMRALKDFMVLLIARNISHRISQSGFPPHADECNQQSQSSIFSLCKTFHRHPFSR